ncbi:MAG: hypothetical protein A2748_00250 [Candidatus Wildermuthbacteria bacterium RIFCSPHIGHO2_01_FULL_45_20]|uniref:Uncharacterized protein n=1 Tax=Candidatus Wildermuthbacteria bacterium RIFCSPHIGHO2_02_FULL_45_25 TaxID=1802450 RepID=A0A1G2R079_9BACT|nr:MAG: hypothetical protein A2748_00250 [Candidatus Wildermuthbacteria bacterium RIFCSPHIGHO2_01_FULL_45_20]OHA65481.1 MAG: hypothetical protein A3C04_02695 [Candidatus Wildermuthbacteria bacterium RIFCSPHIGHO2_02_FULL_45_25]
MRRGDILPGFLFSDLNYCSLNYETSAYKVLRTLGARLAGAPGIFQQKNIRVLKTLYALVS